VTSAPDLFGDFTVPRPFTPAVLATAPEGGAVHVLRDASGAVLYVGATGALRRRLRQHLSSGSVLHDQVVAELDPAVESLPEAYARHTISWREVDDPVAAKARLLEHLQPRYNRQGQQGPTTWWVNQGQAYAEESRLGIVFAGLGGNAGAHHLDVARMAVGDVVVHYRRGHVVALGEVVTAPVQGRRPYGPIDERDHGWLARVEYFPLEDGIPLASLPARSTSDGPFDVNGNVKQGYLFRLDDSYVEDLRSRSGWPAGSPWADGERKLWMFQANPMQWDLAAKLPDMPPGHVEDWTVTRYRTEMRPGDGVLLWASGTDGGIHLVGRLTSEPQQSPTPDFRPADADPSEYRVDFRVVRHVAPHITRTLAKSTPELADLAVLQQANATNFRVTPRQWRAVHALVPLEGEQDEDAHTQFVGGSGMEDLADLVALFRQERGYPTETDAQRGVEREELAVALTAEALTDLNVPVLHRLAGPAYGSPGPQPGFNALLSDEVGRAQVARTLLHLLHGDGPLVDRLADCLQGGYKLPRVGEAVLVKALAVAQPEAWFPGYVSRGEAGKLAVLDLLGRPDSRAGSQAEVAVRTNETIRRLLEPHFADDSWAMQAFSWWLLHREHVPESSLAALADELYLTEEFLAESVELLEDKGQVVFYGPPGTGKTFVARRLAGHLARGGGLVEKVQFHPSYAYEDFIEGYRPRLSDGGQVTYEVVDGPLKRIAAQANERPDVTHVLLIDELNRGNVAKILGELLFLLEYRDEEIRLQYSETPFALPTNLKIIATMNTADRSIALVDTALRRRFHFVPFFPDTPPIDGVLRRWLEDHAPELAWVADVVDRANIELADRNLAIGPSHFLRPGLSEQAVKRAWRYSVLPFLEEHFYGDPTALERFALDRLRPGG